MEFNEKLQQLRTGKNLTQEQTLLTDIFILSIYFHLQTLPQYILQSIGLFLLF